MAFQRIATTRQQDLQTLGTAGQTATAQWATLTTLLRGAPETSAAHARLFAEPVPSQDGGETGWYTEIEGAARPFDTLPDAERAVVHQRLDDLVGGIRALAERLRGARERRDGSQRHFAELIDVALSLPGRDCIYVVAGQPVLVAWGHARAGRAPEPVPIIGRVTPPPPPPMRVATPPPAAPIGPLRPAPQWRWFALGGSLLLLALAILLLLTDPFGWLRPPDLQCRLDPSQLAELERLRGARAEEGVLRAQLAELTNEAGRQHQQCPAPTPPPAPPPAPTPSDIVRERGGQAGKMQITLVWHSTDDLDLFVDCPNDERIKHNHKKACGGELDIDANAPPNPIVNDPVEHVSFAEPAPGRYRVLVDFYAQRSAAPPIPFQIIVHRDGMPDRTIDGNATELHIAQPMATVEVPAP
jgi:hypothetical protein